MTTKVNTVTTYTANDHVIVDVLKGAGHPMTLAEINAATGLAPLKPGSMTAAIRKGLITKGEEIKVKRPAKREVSTYSFVTADALKGGKDGKAFNYTSSETNILAAAATMPKDAPFTLAELSAACGSEIKSGNINSLVKKGNLAKVGTRKVDCETTAKVSTYVFAADVPADAAA